jgi:hypothetical protein
MAAEMAQQRRWAAWGARTMRTDAWWVEPALTFAVLLVFVLYATYRVFENAHYSAGIYHSPFGNPDLRPLIPFLAALPITISPAMVLLPFPAGFRFTCYYYRKAYYRSFVQRPIACAVKGWTPRDYWGERGPIVFQNLHRYFMYAAVVVLAFNLYDAIGAFGLYEGHLYVGVGSILFAINVITLAGYTLGCHSVRHLVGGRLNEFSCDTLSRARYDLWGKVTWLNGRHMAWAWVSLIMVMVLDLYVRAVATGAITDLRLI